MRGFEKKARMRCLFSFVRSIQLGPGLGGYQPGVLFDLLETLKRHRGPCAVTTACRCHGVVTGGRRI